MGGAVVIVVMAVIVAVAGMVGMRVHGSTPIR